MRKITPLQILTFALLAGSALALALVSAPLLLGGLPLGDFRGVALTTATVALLYVYALLAYRGLMRVAPLRAGEIAPGSKQEFVYQVYLLFFLLLFYPVMRCGFVPVPLMRVFYIALGARMGDNSYASGIVFDPLFVEFGANCIVGQSAQIIPHVVQGQRLAMYPVRIGNDVTIGANAVVMADVTIGDGATVAIGAVVAKGSRIGAGESWGGIPARRLGSA